MKRRTHECWRWWPALPVWCVLSGASACNPSPTEHRRAFKIELNAVSDDGRALADVTFTRGPQKLGKTAAGGKLSLELAGVEGQSAELTVGCPDGFSRPPGPVSVRLATTRAVGQSGSRPLTVEAVCERPRREVALVVHAEGRASLPVRVNGELATTTDADGNGHVLMEVDRQLRTLEVELGGAMPKGPAAQVSRKLLDLGPGDTVLVYEPELYTSRPAPRSARAAASTRHVPTRID
jgi:hypothetical protein